VGFLILDGMLGYPAALYDASWIEYGQMVGVEKGGALANDSQWRTDTTLRSGVITYAVDNGVTVDTPTGVSSYSLRADMVNVNDSWVCGRDNSGSRGVIAPGY
jgi:hypothetical protein